MGTLPAQIERREWEGWLTDFPTSAKLLEKRVRPLPLHSNSLGNEMPLARGPLPRSWGKFIVTGDTRILHERFLKREISIERGRANKIGFDVPYKLFDQWCRNLDGFDVGGKIITVDTSDFGSVDFEEYICLAKRFLYEN